MVGSLCRLEFSSLPEKLGIFLQPSAGRTPLFSKMAVPLLERFVPSVELKAALHTTPSG